MQSETDKKVRELISQVRKILAEEDQGFVFSTYTEKEVDDRPVQNCITTSDPEKFWLSMIPLVLNMNKICPEDKRDEFKEDFIAFVGIAVEECFPSITMKAE